MAWTHHAVFDLKPETDVYWCTADIGWVTGHSYIVYGPLANGATQVMYEGTPDTPHRGRFWELIEKYRVTILYTAPTAIRTFMKWGDDIPAKFDLSSLRLLGSVGEPINPEAWMWYREHIGGDRCPIVDTWWQTETGAIMISPLPGVTAHQAGLGDAARCPASPPTWSTTPAPRCPTAAAATWSSATRGRACCARSGATTSASSTRTGRGSTGLYFAGDGAKRDDDGDLWLLGRVDDVMLISGHNISTTEVESALVSHPKVAESAVVGATDPTTGQAIVAFVILRGSAEGGEALVQELRDHVAKTLGPIAKPRQILLVPELPKTRSGKIMRRLLRDVAENRSLGDVTTLQDSTVMDLISTGLQDRHRPGGLTGTDRAARLPVAPQARAGRDGRHPADESSVLLEGDWTHRFVSANGSRFHIAEAGTGPLVLLLHGFPEFWARVAAPDHRRSPAPGSGRSRSTCADTARATSRRAATTATPWRPTSSA